MKVLVTGAKGFVGKNLCAELANIAAQKDRSFGMDPDITVFEYDLDTDPALLQTYCAECDFVLHLAGVNRPKDPSEFMSGNFGFTSTLLDTLKACNNTCPVMISSSTQAALDNPYGHSKKAGEDLLLEYGRETGAKVLVYRFPNVFGKWCRPNYNSAVATFCNNIASDLPITVNDRGVQMTLVYIDDVVTELIHALMGNETREGDYCRVPIEHKITLGEIVDLIYSFKDCETDLSVPDMSDPFTSKLYTTYLSYLPTEKFIYDLKMNTDPRGSFTEIIRSADRGQFSVNISRPSVTKGNHWHHSKHEKFVVVKGEALIQLRKVGLDENGNAFPVQNFRVSGEHIQVVQMIPGYTHNIINLSKTEDLVTFMWANECFNPDKPDTFFEGVE